MGKITPRIHKLEATSELFDDLKKNAAVFGIAYKLLLHAQSCKVDCDVSISSDMKNEPGPASWSLPGRLRHHDVCEVKRLCLVRTRR